MPTGTWCFDGEIAEQVDKLCSFATVELQSRPEGPHEGHQTLLLLGARVAADRVDESVSVPAHGRHVAVEQEAEDEPAEQTALHRLVQLDDETAASAALRAHALQIPGIAALLLLILFIQYIISIHSFLLFFYFLSFFFKLKLTI